VAKSVRKARS